jgi:glyoxylase-like metal-dependent hydrolase (beta-lactamase superfamily II)
MKRPAVLGMVVGGGLVAMTVLGQAPQPPAAPANAPRFPPIESIETIATNLYRITGEGGNTAVLVRGDGVLLVDTKLANNGQKILDQVRKVTDKPITHIVNTHTHGDHTGSNSFFPASVEVVTQENTATNMAKMPAFQSAEGKVGVPDRTFKDKLTLFSGRESVDLYYFGAGHTNGDAFVVFRDARVMHSGDIFATKGLPLLDVNNGGSGVAIGDTLTKAANGISNVDRIITGHTDTLPWRDLVDYAEFNRLFLEHARTSRAAGKTPEQAAADLKLPEKFSGYNLTARGGPANNLTIIYGELAR